MHFDHFWVSQLRFFLQILWKSIVANNLFVRLCGLFRVARSIRIVKIDPVNPKSDTISFHPLKIIQKRPKEVAFNSNIIQMDGFQCLVHIRGQVLHSLNVVQCFCAR